MKLTKSQRRDINEKYNYLAKQTCNVMESIYDLMGKAHDSGNLSLYEAIKDIFWNDPQYIPYGNFERTDIKGLELNLEVAKGKLEIIRLISW